MEKESLFKDAPDLNPVFLKKGISVPELIQAIGKTCFEARNVFRGAELFKKMINENDTIWLGIAGAGIAGGMGGMVISLIENGFIDVICSTGAQVYHDLHFAFDLPVKRINPHCNDDKLRKHGDTRIYDIGIRDVETLSAQDALIRKFIRETYDALAGRELASWEFNYLLGKWVCENAPHPEKSFVAAAARNSVPIFWDSHTNHSIAMNFVFTKREGMQVQLSAESDIFDSAAIVYASQQTGFVELGGGGPKNFIQQTSPTLDQILKVNFEGADRGLQIGTAVERDGSLSSCTFSEAVTWKKYQTADEQKLVQIWGEYSVIFPLLVSYVLDLCESRNYKRIINQIGPFREKLETARCENKK